MFRLTLIAILLLATFLFLIKRSDPWNPKMGLVESNNFRVYHDPNLARSALELKTLLEDRGLSARKALGLINAEQSKSDWYLYAQREQYLTHRYSPVERLFVQQDELGSESQGEFFIVEDSKIEPAYLLEIYLKYLLKTYYPKLDDWMHRAVLSYFCWQDGSGEERAQAPGPDILINSFTNDEQMHLSWLNDSRGWGDAWIAFLLASKPIGLSQILLAGVEYPKLFEKSHDSLYLDWLNWLSQDKPADPRKIVAF